MVNVFVAAAHRTAGAARIPGAHHRLFNPNYVGQRLLDYGYIPALGTSLNWSLFVISIHVVWSVATPILIAEGVAAERRTQSRRTYDVGGYRW